MFICYCPCILCSNAGMLMTTRTHVNLCLQHAADPFAMFQGEPAHALLQELVMEGLVRPLFCLLSAVMWQTQSCYSTSTACQCAHALTTIDSHAH